MFYAGFLIAVIQVIRTQNRGNIAGIVAFFTACIDVYTRMAKLPVFYMIGMYSTIFILVLGMMVEKKSFRPSIKVIIYMLCLLPGLVMVDFDRGLVERISGNLSGPFLLFISCLYFYGRKLEQQELKKMFVAALLALFFLLVNVIFFSSLSLQAFASLESTSETSGGFGPNQVSSALGLGAIILIAARFMKIQLFKIKYVDLLLLFLFILRAALTFSRGGVWNVVGAVTVGIYFLLKNASPEIRKKYIGYYIIPGTVAFIGLAFFVNNITDGNIFLRYQGISWANKMGYTTENKLLSGRGEIMELDLEIFADHPFVGTGPGESKRMRKEYGYHSFVAAHTEYTRLLAEHGIYGLIALIMLVSLVVEVLSRKVSIEQQFLSAMFITYSLSAQLHAAMRIGAIPFFFGVGFMIIMFHSNPLESVSTRRSQHKMLKA
jgi:hypothetical protein